MRTGVAHATRSALVLCALVAALATAPRGAAAPADEAANTETVLLLLGGPLRALSGTPFVQLQPGRYIAAGSLQRACLTPTVQSGSLLLYFADSQRCELIAESGKLQLRQRLHAITGRLPPADLLQQVQERSTLALAAVPRSPDSRALKCFCASNTAPEGAVACEVQSRTAGTRIATIDYFASDADGDLLSGEFTHQRDAEPVQNGLPAPLTSSCDAVQGALTCSVSGNAPVEAGDLQLMLAVDDGAASLQLISLLELTPASAGQIFRDSFETPVCP